MKRAMKPLILLLLLCPFIAMATDRNAASCSQADISTAMSAAVAGDRVVIPSGTCNWTTALSWTAPANVTIIGAGTAATGGGDQTVIVDNYATNAPLMIFNVANTGTFRMTGITVQGGTGALKDAGLITIGGPGTIRLDHLHLNSKTYSPASNGNVKLPTLGAGIRGVLDHSILDLYSTSAVYVLNGGDNGNTEWATATQFGSNDYFFIEDNIINGDAAAHSTRITDCYAGGKIVTRFNTLTAASINEDHATGHVSIAGSSRSCRSHEFYGNSLAPDVGQTEANFALTDIGGGTALVWGNTAADGSAKNVFHFNVTRKNNDTYGQIALPSGWGYCGTDFNGTGSAYDQNASAGTGYACMDQPGRGIGDLMAGEDTAFHNVAIGGQVWPRQALEPMYIWSNDAAPATGWGGNFYSNSTGTASGDRVQADRDYYAQASGIQTSATSPFNGTTGTGWGTIANRPTTCTTGVGYFATNQGSWNTSASNPYGVQQNGADGLFYTCTSTNTWTLYYTPYTYPHPLQGGASAPVLASLTCSPDPVQTPSTTDCTVSVTSGTPTSYIATIANCGSPARASSVDTTSPVTFTVTYGGSCDLCAQANSDNGTSNTVCDTITAKYNKPSNLQVH